MLGAIAAATALFTCHVTRPPAMLQALSDAAICAPFKELRGAVEVRLSRNGVASARLVRGDRIVAETSLAVADREFRTDDVVTLARDLVRAAPKSY